MSNPIKISLCMIVKNEAVFIEECLRSFQDAVDEIIVVDTGSTDETVLLAEQAGAKIFHFEWCDDFAAARNESIRHAQGEWVLWMDADERLAPGGAKVLRDASARTDVDFGYLPFHDARKLEYVPEEVLSGRARLGEPYMLPRLLRRLPDLRFEGVVHENVNTWLTLHKRGHALETAAIHLGYVPELRRARDKDRRNLKLLKERALLEPDNATVHGFLAQEHLILGEIEQARAAAEVGWKAAEANPNAFSYSLRLAMVRAQLQLQAGAPEDALRTVIRAEQQVGPHPDLHLFGGVVLLRMALEVSDPVVRRDQMEGAGDAFQAALSFGDQVFAERCMGRSGNVLGLMGLGTVALLAGRPENALYCFDQALDIEPDNQDVHVSRAEALVGLERAPEALKILEPLLGEGPDAWLIAALAAETLGEIETSNMLLRRVSELLSARPYSDLHRKYLQATMESRSAAYAGEPQSGEGAVGAATALLAGKLPERPAIALDDCERNEVQVLLRNMVGSGREDLLKRLDSNRADRALPGIRSLVHAVAPEMAARRKQRKGARSTEQEAPALVG